MKKGLIIGKGWIGRRFENSLNQLYDLTSTKRKSDSKNCTSINFDEAILPHKHINSFDFLIITIPFGKRNTISELKYRFNNLINYIKYYTGQIILISSTGIYPNSEDIICENSFEDQDLIVPYITIENLMQRHFTKLTILRLGGMMGNDRYLSKYLNLDSENLEEIVNHVHYIDIINVINTCIINNTNSVIYNVVAPNHPTKREVLEYQINQKIFRSETKKGKTISSKKLINELNYHFLYSNPLYFMV